MRFNSRVCGLGLALLLSQASAQSTNRYGSQNEPPRENRTLRVATNAEGTPVAPGATFTLFSANGAGSVERVQFAAIGDVLAQENSRITIDVDGVSYSATTGVFFLNQWQSDGGLAAGNFFATKNLANTYSQINGNPVNGMGAYRKIYIPYYRSISITYTNASQTTASLYTQVDYFSGKPPLGLHPRTQTYFHMYTYPMTRLAQFEHIEFLPSVVGTGAARQHLPLSVGCGSIAAMAGSESKAGHRQRAIHVRWNRGLLRRPVLLRGTARSHR